MSKRHWFAAVVTLESTDGWVRKTVTALSCGEAASVDEAKGIAVDEALAKCKGEGYTVCGVMALRVPPEAE